VQSSPDYLSAQLPPQKVTAHVLCMGAGVFEKGKKEKEKEGVFV
jgi:hypothetical protein